MQETSANEETQLDRLYKLFQAADTDGNGVIDRQELDVLLRSTDGGLQPATLACLGKSELHQVMCSYDADGSGDIDFEEFQKLVADGLLLDGTMQEYQEVFRAADTTGDGKLNASEIQDFFAKLGQPLRSDKLFKIFEEHDLDGSGLLEFDEFVRLFRAQLLDLDAILDFMRMQPSPEAPSTSRKLIEVEPGRVTTVFSTEEFDTVMTDHADTLVVVEASLTWCRPCKGFERTFEKFAEHYNKVIFLKFFGNSNDNCKYLFKDRLRTPLTPSFTFHRNGVLLHSHQGANKVKLENLMQRYISPEEDPLAGASAFKRQVWHAKLGIN
ncbi:hypothetical protein WJX72_010210 [[Myrmecia] bisecta]|uniref:Calmodulin n=1 Tax=[Myrmecia] bisecta TaxID=41462 RepID=A0AAW1PKR1_9CHLO